MKICPVPKRELNCWGTATSCLAYFLKRRVVHHVYKWNYAERKRVPANRDVVARTKAWFTRIETIIVNILWFVVVVVFLFRKLLKRHPIHFWCVCKCFMAALLHYRDVDFADQGQGWDSIFFLFLGWKIAGKSVQSAGYRRQPPAILNPGGVYLNKSFYLEELRVSYFEKSESISSLIGKKYSS